MSGVDFKSMMRRDRSSRQKTAARSYRYAWNTDLHLYILGCRSGYGIEEFGVVDYEFLIRLQIQDCNRKYAIASKWFLTGR
jgi:hypothetical protein